jgi:hypothetical protein
MSYLVARDGRLPVGGREHENLWYYNGNTFSGVSR